MFSALDRSVIAKVLRKPFMKRTTKTSVPKGRLELRPLNLPAKSKRNPLLRSSRGDRVGTPGQEALLEELPQIAPDVKFAPTVMSVRGAVREEESGLPLSRVMVKLVLAGHAKDGRPSR